MKSFSSYLAELHIRLEYHDTLNPKLWTDGKLDPKVRQKLLQFGEAWRQYANIPADAVKDVIMIGGNCNYNYTSVSDIDVHLIVDKAKMGKGNPLLDDYLQDKKVMWTMTHDIKVYGYPLEPYAQDSEASYPVNQGVFSLKHNEWINKPEYLGKDFAKDKHLIKKVKFYMNMIDHMIDNKVHTDHTAKLRRKLREMRGAGIQKAGEFSFENLVFKELRNHGYLDKMNDYERKEQDKKLSLYEHVVNIFPNREDSKNQETMQHHLPTINHQIDDNYSGIGGFKGSRKFEMHKVITRKDENGKSRVVAGAAYKGLGKGRRKLSVIHHDGTKEGKGAVANIVADDLKTGRAVHQFSGSMIGFTQKALQKNGKDIKDYILPVHKVKKIFPDEHIGEADPNHEEVKAHPDLPWFTTKVGPPGKEQLVHKIALSGAKEHHND